MNPMNRERGLVEKQQPHGGHVKGASLWRAHATADGLSLPVDAESNALPASWRKSTGPRTPKGFELQAARGRGRWCWVWGCRCWRGRLVAGYGGGLGRRLNPELGRCLSGSDRRGNRDNAFWALMVVRANPLASVRTCAAARVLLDDANVTT